MKKARFILTSIFLLFIIYCIIDAGFAYWTDYAAITASTRYTHNIELVRVEKIVLEEELNEEFNEEQEADSDNSADLSEGEKKESESLESKSNDITLAIESLNENVTEDESSIQKNSLIGTSSEDIKDENGAKNIETIMSDSNITDGMMDANMTEGAMKGADLAEANMPEINAIYTIEAAETKEANMAEDVMTDTVTN